MFVFARAVKSQRKARIGIVGPSGSGKTWTSLAIATGLAGPGGRVAVIDTENASASLYADVFDFDCLQLDTFSPLIYVEAIKAAEKAGYAVIVIDSLSHAWMGKDGALEQVDKVMVRNKSANSFTAWREVTPMHNALVDAIIRSKAHIVATMRAKTEYIVETDPKTGKVVPRKVGLAPVQREGMEYEFDLVADMDHEHRFIVSKTRIPFLTDEVIVKPGAELGERIRTWLESGEPAAERPTPPAAVSPDTSTPTPADTSAPITMEERKKLFALAKRAGISDDELRALLVNISGQASTSNLTRADYEAICDILESQAAVKSEATA